jgi:hypothetical protein
VSKKELLEKIKQAKYECDYAPLSEKHERLEHLNRLLDQAQEGTHLSRSELLEAIEPRDPQYKVAPAAKKPVSCVASSAANRNAYEPTTLYRGRASRQRVSNRHRPAARA